MPLSLFHLHGDLKDLRFPRLLAALREDDFTGVFQATTRPAGHEAASESEITREVHFTAGHVAWAISTDRDESLRAYLLRSGTITEARWAEAEQKAREGTLRQALIDLGIVNARELTQIEKGRAEEIVLALFGAREGEYRVRERQLSPGTPDLRIDARPLILKGVLEGGDRSLVLDEVGSLDTVYVVKRPALEEPGLSLPGEFQSVLRHVDGKRTIAQICSLTALPDNFVCSVFAALSLIGAVRRNYEKSHPRGRGEIVKGAEVAAQDEKSAAPAASPARTSAHPATDVIPMAPMAPVARAVPAGPPPASGLAAPLSEQSPGPAPEIRAEAGKEESLAQDAGLDLESEDGPDRLIEEEDGEEEDGEEEAAPDEPEPVRLPPITRRPHDAEPIGRTSGRPQSGDRSAHDAGVDRGASSAYGAESMPESSRPWFLLGGAAAVGFAALFLILMAQNPGDAGEVVRPISEATSQPGMPPVSGDDAPASSLPPAGDAGSVTADSLKAQERPENAYTAEKERPEVPVATGAESDILKSVPGSGQALPDRAGSESAGAGHDDQGRPETGRPDGKPVSGRRSLASGDYLAASRYFGHEVSSRAGQFTIQLLTACQDETVRRAVENARGSKDIFILSTRLEGRDCYRVFWGKYPSATRAREALRHDVPSTFLQDRSQPRITRLGG